MHLELSSGPSFKVFLLFGTTSYARLIPSASQSKSDQNLPSSCVPQQQLQFLGSFVVLPGERMPPSCPSDNTQQQGYLEYFALPPDTLGGVAERDTPGLARRTARRIRDARLRPDLSLRTCGFQLFRALPPPPPRRPGRDGEKIGRQGMRGYQRAVESFVRSQLEDPAHFTLRPGEQLGLVMSYNYAVRSTDRRAFGGSDAIRHVHTDFTQDSGPVVLRHVLARVHQWPSAASDEEEGAEAAAATVPSAARYTDEILSGKRDCRYLFLNVWRSTDTEHAVSSWPLALLHPGSWSLDGTDHAVQHSKQAGSIYPQNYLLRADSEGGDGHDWYVYSAMEESEGIIFINYDSDPTAPQYVFHGACDLDTQPAVAAAVVGSAADSCDAGVTRGVGEEQGEPAAGGTEGVDREEAGVGKGVDEGGEGGPAAGSSFGGAGAVRTSVEVRLLVIIERDGVERRVCGTKGLWPAVDK
ncbi:hypothetical protein CYMTET_8223 [Cymbomonas tetramitiformis]|uniref:Uncharacterized protein n=1 Tax=Cymbomonas tetramitiformis TaxID=36881 RepID=A0AAE0GU37_9CHLO|nr:hypothetical protein CYMTET_8223 [Cymbomonas tetramitiformis]